MSSTDTSMSFFRTMKGAPHSVLSVIAYNGRPMTNRELQVWTGYHADTITRVTHDLIDMGWLEARTPVGPWMLAHGRAVPGMPGSVTSADRSIRPGEIPRYPSENPGSASDNPGFASENPGSPSGSGFWLEEDGNPMESANQPPELGRPRISETLEALRDVGIHDPAASRLARLPHISAEYVRGHVERARAEGRGLGAAIFRMQRGWRVSAKPSAKSRSEEVAEQIRRFVEGE